MKAPYPQSREDMELLCTTTILKRRISGSFIFALTDRSGHAFFRTNYSVNDKIMD